MKKNKEVELAIHWSLLFGTNIDKYPVQIFCTIVQKSSFTTGNLIGLSLKL
jgi:hypothetical protein